MAEGDKSLGEEYRETWDKREARSKAYLGENYDGPKYPREPVNNVLRTCLWCDGRQAQITILRDDGASGAWSPYPYYASSCRVHEADVLVWHGRAVVAGAVGAWVLVPADAQSDLYRACMPDACLACEVKTSATLKVVRF